MCGLMGSTQCGFGDGVDYKDHWRKSNHLFACFGGRNGGAAVTKQRMSHWITDAMLKPIRCAAIRYTCSFF